MAMQTCDTELELVPKSYVKIAICRATSPTQPSLSETRNTLVRQRALQRAVVR